MEVKKWVLMLILMAILLVGGCIKEKIAEDVAEAKNSPGFPKDSDSEPVGVKAMVGDQYPAITARVSPSNPSLDESFTLTIEAEDDKGLKHLIWESSNFFSNYGSPGVFECDMQKTCSNSWEFITIEEGLHELIVYAVDSSGKETGKTPLEVNVGPARETVKKSASVCGNGNCESLESESSCPEDCGAKTNVPPVCGNGVCEGGESYESCSDDCTLKNIIGTSPGDGACDPGEDINNAPNDCTTINPNCGNDVCDPGETRLTCYADCKEDTPDSGSSCDSHSDCGYKQRCIGSVCQSVQCTSDSHCSGCKRCSDNRCVSCGYGSAGYCTC